MLLAAAALTILVGLAHSYLGEKYILIRLFRRPLPKLFGDDTFTKHTLRFTWHITTVAWFGFAVLLVCLHVGEASDANVLYIVGTTSAISAIVALVGSRGRHLSWVAFSVISVICFLAAA